MKLIQKNKQSNSKNNIKNRQKRWIRELKQAWTEWHLIKKSIYYGKEEEADARDDDNNEGFPFLRPVSRILDIWNARSRDSRAVRAASGSMLETENWAEYAQFTSITKTKTPEHRSHRFRYNKIKVCWDQMFEK